MAIEDKNFYTHGGVSITSIIRATFRNISAGGYVQGASTIDQQIIKNSLLSSDKNLVRKIKEIILSLKLDSQLSKDKILNIYLNDSPYGGSVYGVEEASLLYFNKHAKDLTINESAYLAAIPKSPTKLSPINGNRESLEKRKNNVLQAMYDTGYINTEQLKENLSASYNFTNIASSSGKALHFVFMVKKYLEDKYGVDVVENSGLKVITTLDWDFQKLAEDTINENFRDYIKNNDKRNTAFMAADPVTGQILSMVGSRNYFDKNIDGQFNVTLAKRNPGSSFKPFIYLKGFMSGLTPESIIFDVHTQFSTNCDEKNPTKENTNCYSPQNYTSKNYGPISARVALQNSINVPAVKMLYLVGITDMLDFAVQLGINSYKNNNSSGLSLALGGSSVSLYEMLQGYSVLANSGTKNDLHFILKITDYTNKVLEEENLNPIQVVPVKYINVISDVLSDNNARNLVFPTNNSMFFDGRPVAAKTGTTQDYKDA
ncbi:MAG: transglycosylase domain-containing protein [Candidatus Pacebacteria bacterium]|nr:transglycosylase domain-containing protein [Candidatus Paceibacterota bacterium]